MHSKINNKISLLTVYFLGMLLSFHLPLVFAQDLGSIGSVYSISETDFVLMAQKKIQEKLSGNNMSGWQAQQQELFRVAIDRPSPVHGLHPTILTRHWLWDPSFTIPYDVRAANGRILLKAGSRFNPLKKTSLKKALIFFDDDDPEQVTWVEEQNQAVKGKVLLILVNGSIRETASHFPRQRIYFDQGGLITQKLSITQIPAIVTQVNDQLEIQEVKP